jgi:preprotein translocase subunit SecG
MKKIFIVFLVISLILIIAILISGKKGVVSPKGLKGIPSRESQKVESTPKKEEIIEVPVEVKIEEKK